MLSNWEGISNLIFLREREGGEEKENCCVIASTCKKQIIKCYDLNVTD